jgi:3-oxoacyl-[acyl-carrier protein] reductase
MNVLVTGVSRGVGLEAAKALLEKGDTVIGISRSITKDLEALKNQYLERLKLIQFDLSKVKEIKTAIVQPLLEEKLVIHGFINNAAIAYEDLITNLDIDQLQNMININQIAPMILTKYVLRSMLLYKIQGSIVHITSISAHSGFKGLGMYAATKGAMEAFSLNVAREWGSLGIRSNTIAAGFMDTDMTSAMSDEQRLKIAKRAALKKATEISSVVSSALFLLSDGASSISGQCIHVDSGLI